MAASVAAAPDEAAQQANPQPQMQPWGPAPARKGSRWENWPQSPLDSRSGRKQHQLAPPRIGLWRVGGASGFVGRVHAKSATDTAEGSPTGPAGTARPAHRA